MAKLGVNIDHVATVREARKTFEPDPVQAVQESENAGCDGIVCHLRKDRRHIKDKDLRRIRKAVTTQLNLEMSVDPEIVDIALKTLPDQATIVPENRQEITTEGGLDVVFNFSKIVKVVRELKKAGIEVSLFIDPEKEQIEASAAAGAGIVEFHTGKYAEAYNSGRDHMTELSILRDMTLFAVEISLIPAAGHGLTYGNVRHVAGIKEITEFNIGHSIVSRAVFTGIGNAVKEMKELVK